MSTSSNHTKAFVQCCHGKHIVASSRTLLSDHVDCPIVKAVQASLSVGLGENIKCVDTNDTQQLQELLAKLQEFRWKMKGL